MIQTCSTFISFCVDLFYTFFMLFFSILQKSVKVHNHLTLYWCINPTNLQSTLIYTLGHCSNEIWNLKLSLRVWFWFCTFIKVNISKVAYSVLLQTAWFWWQFCFGVLWLHSWYWIQRSTYCIWNPTPGEFHSTHMHYSEYWQKHIYKYFLSQFVDDKKKSTPNILSYLLSVSVQNTTMIFNTGSYWEWRRAAYIS